MQTLGGWLWPLPDAVNRLGPVHGVLLKKLALQSVGAAVAAFSLKVTLLVSQHQAATRLAGNSSVILTLCTGATDVGHSTG